MDRLKWLALVLVDLLLLAPFETKSDIRHFILENWRKSYIERRAFVMHSYHLILTVNSSLEKLEANQV